MKQERFLAVLRGKSRKAEAKQFTKEWKEGKKRKPHLYMLHSLWCCSSGWGMRIGCGATQKEAYNNWEVYK